MKAFSSSLAKSFAVCLPLSAFAVNGLMGRLHSRLAPMPAADCGWIKESPIEPALASPADAKAHRRFWLGFYGALVCGRGGFALNQVELDRIFPGYEDVLPKDAAGEEVWGPYFARVFNLETWHELDSRASGGLSLSWQGNADLFARYGADIILIGSSQVYRSLIPSALSDALPGKPRTLLLSASGLLPENARYMAAKLAPSGRKARAAVLGYTPVMANVFHPDRASKVKAVKNSWHVSSWRTPLELRELLPAPSWKNVFPVTLQDLDPAAQGGPSTLPRFKTKDERELAAAGEAFALSPNNPYFKDYAGVPARDCADPRVAEDLRATIASLLTLADQVVVFVPPATPIIAKAYPCFDRELRRAVKAAEAPNVSVVADEAGAYGLGYGDFLYETAQDGVFVVDPIHTNYAGARKVTARLARVLAPLLKRP